MISVLHLCSADLVALVLPRPHPSQCHGWQIWFSPARAPWTSCPCSVFVSSCFMMLLMNRPQVKKKRKVRVRTSVPRNARWAFSWGSLLLPTSCASQIWFHWTGLLLTPQRQQKQRQLLGRLQDLLLGPKADEQTTCEVLDYFLRRLSSSQVASRVLAMKVSRMKIVLAWVCLRVILNPAQWNCFISSSFSDLSQSPNPIKYISTSCCSEVVVKQPSCTFS